MLPYRHHLHSFYPARSYFITLLLKVANGRILALCSLDLPRRRRYSFCLLTSFKGCLSKMFCFWFSSQNLGTLVLICYPWEIKNVPLRICFEPIVSEGYYELQISCLFVSRKLRASTLQRMMFCLCFTLLLVLILFVAAIERASSRKPVCKAVAIAMHYLLLMVFMWMAAQATLMYYRLVKVFGGQPSWLMKATLCLTFGESCEKWLWIAFSALVCLSLYVLKKGVFDSRKSYSGIAFWIRITHGILRTALATVFGTTIFSSRKCVATHKACAYMCVSNATSNPVPTLPSRAGWTKLCECVTILVSVDYSI